MSVKSILFTISFLGVAQGGVIAFLRTVKAAYICQLFVSDTDYLELLAKTVYGTVYCPSPVCNIVNYS